MFRNTLPDGFLALEFFDADTKGLSPLGLARYDFV